MNAILFSPSPLTGTVLIPTSQIPDGTTTFCLLSLAAGFFCMWWLFKKQARRGPEPLIDSVENEAVLPENNREVSENESNRAKPARWRTAPPDNPLDESPESNGGSDSEFRRLVDLDIGAFDSSDHTYDTDGEESITLDGIAPIRSTSTHCGPSLAENSNADLNGGEIRLNEIAEQLKESQSENDRLENELQSLELECKRSQAQTKELEKQLAELKLALTEARRQMDQSETQRISQAQEIQRLIHVERDSELVITSLQNSVVDLKSRETAEIDASAILAEKLKTIEQENAEIKSELTQAKEEAENAVHDHIQASQQYESLKTMRETESQLVSDVVENLRAESESLKELVQLAEESNERVLQKKQSEIDGLRLHIVAQTDEFQFALNQNQQKIENYDNMVSMHQRMQPLFGRLKKRIERQRDKHTTLALKYRKARTKYKSYRRRYIELLSHLPKQRQTPKNKAKSSSNDSFPRLESRPPHSSSSPETL